MSETLKNFIKYFKTQTKTNVKKVDQPFFWSRIKVYIYYILVISVCLKHLKIL